MSLQYRAFNRAFFISITTAASVWALSGCTQVDERIYPVGHYDSYYGMPLKKTTHPHHKKATEIKATAPKRYIVKKGDTLWGISKKFLVHAEYWPEIWDKNQKIQNPHLIYPGDTLYLSYVKDNTGKLVPRIRVDRGKGVQPVSSLIPFLAWPKVLDENTIRDAPYIIGSRDNHNLITEGERVYINRLQANKGDRFGVFHKEKELIDPESGKSLGFEVDYMGYTRIERSDAISTASIISATREIRRGDKLFRPKDETHGLNVPIHAPDIKVRGSVMSLYDAHAISGQYMIAVINRGKDQGIKVGHVLGIYAEGKTVEDLEEKARAEAAVAEYMKQHPIYPKKKVKPLPEFDIQVELPPEKIGTMVIYKVTDKLSFGLIVESERAVRNGDKIGNP